MLDRQRVKILPVSHSLMVMHSVNIVIPWLVLGSALLWRSAFSNFPDLHDNFWVRLVGCRGNYPTPRHYNAYMWL